MNRLFTILSIALVVAASTCPAGAGQFSESPVRFAIIGDRTGGHVPGIYGQVATEVERLRPDFVMTVGDMIEGYVDDTTRIIREWEEYDSIVEPISSPIYYTPGNHDIWSDISEDLYRRFIGAPYFSFDQESVHFVILDVSRWESSDDIPSEQIDWLIDDLEKHQDSAYTLVFYHKPFWEQTTAEGKPDTLHSLFVRFGVDAVFTGHYHDYFVGEFDGVVYTCIGSSGAETIPSPTGLEYHFAWVTIDKTGLHISPVKMGSVLPWEEIRIEERETFNGIRRHGVAFAEPVPVDGDLTVQTTHVTVVLSNTRSDFALDDTLRWDAPEGWAITPKTMPVSVAPRSEAKVDVEVQCSGTLYPVPSASVNFTYADGKNVTAQSRLWIAREVHAYRANSRPEIDGKISEDCWQDPVTRFFHQDGSEARTNPVQFYFAYDNDNLLIAAHCEDTRIDSLRANVTGRDGGVWGEDCVGYFFEPEYGSQTVYQIYINPLGTVFDQKLTMGDDGYMDGDFDWNGEYEVETMIGEDSWSMEARIPLKQFGVDIEEGDIWRLNFRRKQSRLNCAADWQTPIDYHPSTYGFLTVK
jgi:hypothetical protein